jgi:hypothetical protein
MYGGLLAYNYQTNFIIDIARRVIVYGTIFLTFYLAKTGAESDTLTKIPLYNAMSIVVVIMALIHFKRQYMISSIHYNH